MFSQTFQLGPYLPAFADEQSGKTSDQLSVVDGINFAWRFNSVYSAHGHVPSASLGATPMLHPFSFIINDDQFVLFEDGVYRDDRTGSWSKVFTFSATFTHPEWDLARYKWTSAYVGTRHWFCHPAIGLVWYDVFDGIWGMHREDCWSGPTFAVTHADNRLVVLLSDVVSWSAFDEGHVFQCDWHCGVGTQSLALIRYGQPYAVMPYNNGWLTFTAMGIMVSMPEYGQNIDPDLTKINPGVVVFRHEEVSFEELPVGPTAIEHADESAVFWLAKQGFREYTPAQGGGVGSVKPTFSPFSEFYSEYMIPYYEGAPQDQFMLNYARDVGWLFVSSRLAAEDVWYAHAHVLQRALDRWGSFNYDHVHVGYGRREAKTTIDSMNYGFINAASRVCHVDHRPTVGNWLRFSPMRLQMAQEDVPATTICSVQEVRLGNSRPQWSATPTLGLTSHWLDTKRAEQNPTRCAVYLSGGWDSETQNQDEGRALTPTLPAQNTNVYVGHVTGITHSLVLRTEKPGEHYEITSVEISFFFSGRK